MMLQNITRIRMGHNRGIAGYEWGMTGVWMGHHVGIDRTLQGYGLNMTGLWMRHYRGLAGT